MSHEVPTIRAPLAHRLLWCALLAYALSAWLTFGAGPIGVSWRESDTQAIARSFHEEGFDLLRPRVDWRGATDGAVECECPLYQGVVAVLLRAFGDVEWPGRLVSLLAVVLLVRALFGVLELRTGSWPALVGSLVFLGSTQIAYVGTRVTPDAFSTALAMLGLERFGAWLVLRRRGAFALAMVCTALGMLAKPTAAVVLLVQVAWLTAVAPARWRDWRVWSGFGIAAGLVAAWMLHARAIGLTTGLTFGVTFGDTKMPGLAQLVRPSCHRSLLWATLQYGASWYGAAALLVLAVRRRLQRADCVWLAILAASLLGSLRYSHDAVMGPQYHIYSALLGAYLVARAWPERLPGRFVPLVAAVLVAHAAIALRGEFTARAGYGSSLHSETAAALRACSAPGDLVAIRGPKPRFDAFWQRPNNFEEPVLLYLSHRKGWILPVDEVDGAALERVRAQGARWFVETNPGATSPDLTAWLAGNAGLVRDAGHARIFGLKSR